MYSYDERLTRGNTLRHAREAPQGIRFVIDTTKALLNSQNFEELKRYISTAAATFGRTLGDVTHKLSDIVGDTIDVVRKKTGEAVVLSGEFATRSGEVLGKTYDSVKGASIRAADSTAQTLEKVKSKVSRGKDTADAKPKAPAKRRIKSKATPKTK